MTVQIFDVDCEAGRFSGMGKRMAAYSKKSIVGRQRHIRTLGASAWVLLVTIFFLIEAEHYTGLYAFLAEWQYDAFGQHLPTLTFAVLLIIFCLPALGLLAWRGSSKSAASDARLAGPTALDKSVRFRNALLMFSGALSSAAALVAFYTLFLPEVGPSSRVIDVGSPESLLARPGPITLRGEILFTRTSAFAQNLLITTRGVRFAPIVAPKSRGDHLRFFVELSPSDVRQAEEVITTARRGVLMRESLPGSIIRLYRYAGYTISEPYYVLYASSLTIRWPYYTVAAQLLVASLIALLCTLIQQRYVFGLRKALADL